ncbi:Ornithine decarboxylase antizyme [Trichinella spiralis]|uniref:Ornithine decarboxylase antizyme n=1 Tax=Trichinella spiralis TaxID=6334 RepID=A0ABR3KAX1_TRISP
MQLRIPNNFGCIHFSIQLDGGLKCGVGFKTEPSVLNSDLCMQQFLNNSLQSFEAVRLKFIIGVTDGIKNIWNAIIVSPKCIHLYVTLTDVALLSRKGFISVLEFVTETLKLEEIYLVKPQ